ncbi:rhomboid family intramembrane serine protease [Halovivax sp.]|uniref:rhomboid family intramembrane serine protease n=1 Tax=Halovivax sp. TaxID=1935978 RepID=UPI0025C390A5|nr:rhomboid family intramembrane serine protease [Halovivax sp.]
MGLSPTRIALVLALAVALGYAWYAAGPGRWRSRVEDRLLYGVPWGTLVTVGIVVAFYLVVQDGARNWSEPLFKPFVTWSYFYPTGLLTAGVAHGGPDHLVSNMLGTIVFAPIAEYAWSHYPGGSRTVGDARNDAGEPVEAAGGLLADPWIRAAVVFPAALLGVAVLTALFSLGPGLGFSGAVFAIFGFVLVTYPLAAVAGVVATAALGTLYDALANPVVRETIDPGAPAPPGWAGIGFHAHLLGFLVGVVLAIALVRRRDRRQSAETVFLAVAAVGLVQALWLLSWSAGDDAWVLYRGAGVTFVLLLSVVIAAAVAGEERPLPRPLSILPRAPSRRTLAAVWLVLVGLGFLLGLAAALAAGDAAPFAVAVAVVLSALLALPALPPLVPERVHAGPITRRGAALLALLALTALVALVGVPYGFSVVGDEVPGSGGVEAGDYTVTYERNATADQSLLLFPNGDETTQDGLIVVSDDRELWTVGERSDVIAHDGNATATVGGIGWRETVRAERTGWEVVGNETAYAVDLTVDGETSRSYASEPVRAAAVIDEYRIAVAPTEEDFEVRVTRDDEPVGSASIPDDGDETAVDDLRFRVETIDDTERLVAESGETSVQIAERETYADGE